MPQVSSEVVWYALRTRSRHEKAVRDRLASKGIEPLLPVVKKMSQWKDRRKKIEVPLFSGYCFARFSWNERLPVLEVPGVSDIVGQSDVPEAVPDQEIAALKRLMETTLPFDSHPFLEEGTSVEVIRGPLRGLRGILVKKLNCFRLVISVHLIKKAAAVEIDASSVVSVSAN